MSDSERPRHAPRPGDDRGVAHCGDPVYVHCYGGIGRTGTVVGCWLIEQGAAGDDPIATIAELRANIRFRRPSPETREQVAFVRGWPGPRLKAGATRNE